MNFSHLVNTALALATAGSITFHASNCPAQAYGYQDFKNNGWNESTLKPEGRVGWVWYYSSGGRANNYAVCKLNPDATRPRAELTNDLLIKKPGVYKISFDSMITRDAGNKDPYPGGAILQISMLPSKPNYLLLPNIDDGTSGNYYLYKVDRSKQAWTPKRYPIVGSWHHIDVYVKVSTGTDGYIRGYIDYSGTPNFQINNIVTAGSNGASVITGAYSMGSTGAWNSGMAHVKNFRVDPVK